MLCGFRLVSKFVKNPEHPLSDVVVDEDLHTAFRATKSAANVIASFTASRGRSKSVATSSAVSPSASESRMNRTETLFPKSAG